MRIIITLGLAVTLASCGKMPEKTTADTQPLATTDARKSAPTAFQPWSCPADPGTAPSGRLTAQRIHGADAKDGQARLYEGPVWIDGALYYSNFVLNDQYPSRIERFTPPNRLETAIAESGSNGLAVDDEGYIIAATQDRKEISRYDRHTGERQRIVGEYKGNPFNSPNDLTLTRDGVIYFTDPAFQRSAAPGGQPKTRVYRVEGDKVTVVDETIDNPNGVSLSPAQDVLYVAGGGDKGVLRAYPIVNNKPGRGLDLVQGINTPDGMAIDCLGNIYLTEHTSRRVRVFTPRGEELASIHVDANITNAAFGGPAGKTLYLTGAGALWTIELDVAGFPY